MNKKLLSDFGSPSSVFRGKPFWAWNGKLEPEELRRQIRIMRQMGLGGFFMHSRVGLSTGYLSDEWFECVRACIDEAEKQGMEAWLYDEDRWPSGAAGGLVTKKAKYRMRHLEVEQVAGGAGFRWGGDVVAAFSAKVEGVAASDVKRLSKRSLKKDVARLAPDHCVLVFRVVLEELSPWYNGYTYLDTLSEEAVGEFIKVTHAEYRKRIGKHFGKVVRGIFTDEPNYGRCDGKARSWTGKLPAVFRKRYGYDLVDHLPELYFEVEGQEISRARYHYFDCITHLFVTAFSRQIGQWCEKNGLLYTGHVLAEDTLRDQSQVVGSAMRHYEYMQAPGMDLLTEHWRCYTTAKQVSSAARQFGAKWRLTETYGCTGWDFPFEAHKALGDWQAACGINLRCQHLCWYTMLGEAKRDYPASIFYQSPWWEHYSKVEDYFARVTAVMTRGTEVRDLLVIHPVESMWTMAHRDWGKDEKVRQYDQMFNDLTSSLLAEQIDFDYGDEEILSRHGKVTTVDGRGVLKVAKAVYRAVLVGPLKTMRGSTLALLRRFAAAGGTVVFAGEVARHVDAQASEAVVEFASTCARSPAEGTGLAEAVGPTCRRIRVTDGAGRSLSPVVHLLREDKENFYLFVANTSHVPGVWNHDPLVRDRRESFDDVRITGFEGCQGAPIELEAATGARYAADAARTIAGWEIRTSLPRIGSRLYVVPKQEGETGVAGRPRLRDVRVEAVGGGPWEITLSEANNLVLDRARYRIGGGEWQGPEEILRVDRAVREALGVAVRGGAMVQPWARAVPEKRRRAVVSLAYGFRVQSCPTGELCLAIEGPERFRIAMNGQGVSGEVECGWWTDRSLRKLRMDPSVLKVGENEVVLECDFDETFSGLEMMYLLGNFGVHISGTEVTMSGAAGTLGFGDWVGQGLAFYSGSVTYRRRVRPRLEAGERLFVRVGEYRGVAVRVLVDGRSAGIIGWEPSEVEITEFVRGSEVELGVEVLGHRRNSHGPLHHKELWPTWTGPGEFVSRDERWEEGYQLVPCGLMREPELVVRA